MSALAGRRRRTRSCGWWRRRSRRRRPVRAWWSARAVVHAERAGEHVEELAAGVLVRADGWPAFGGQELGEVGVDLAVGHQVAEALKEVGRVVDAGLRQAHAVLAAMDAEEGHAARARRSR